MSSPRKDLLYALRGLVRAPAFTVTALVTLALGIGANTAIFTVINGVLLEPLPFVAPHRIVEVQESNPEGGYPRYTVSPLNFRDFRSQSKSFSAIAATRRANFTISEDNLPEIVVGAETSAGYFQVLGVPPALGRSFYPEDDEPGAGRVAILNHDFWQSRFGGDPQIIGKSLRINGEDVSVVGVAQPDLGLEPKLWVPMAMDFEQSHRAAHFLKVYARLAPGVSMADANHDLESIASGLAATYPATNSGWTAVVEPLREQIISSVRPALRILLLAAGLVLFIACANLANLALARLATREEELAVRAAMGAGRWSLALPVVLESLLLAIFGGLLGTCLALWGTKLLVALSAGSIPRADNIEIDGKVLLFTLALSLGTSILFGLLPALHAARLTPQGMLKEGGRGHIGGAHRKLTRKVLIPLEVALTLTLLICAGLLIRSFVYLQQAEPGFSPDNVLTTQLALPSARYPDDGAKERFYQRLFERLEGLPGATQTGAIFPLPLSGRKFDQDLFFEGRPLPADTLPPSSPTRAISPGYFQTMRIPLIQGRDFDGQDTSASPPVVIVSESAARRFWPDDDPLGQRLSFDDPLSEDGATWCSVIGIVSDVRFSDLGVDNGPEIYWPFFQSPTSRANLVLRTEVDPAILYPAVRALVAEIDPDLAVQSSTTMSEVVASSVARPRFNASLIGMFGLLALVLASVGVYGLLAHSVYQRVPEIGLRMAFGASRSDILRMILQQGMVPVWIGLAIGLASAFLTANLLAGLLHGIRATDPLSFTIGTLLLAGVAFAACLVPALRSSRIPPSTALRG